MRYAVVAFTFAALFAQPSWAAYYTNFDCPANVRSEVTSPLPDGWIATPQSSAPAGARVETMGARQVLACKYRMFGTIYTVWREIPSGHDQCLVSRTNPTQFTCRIIPPARRL